MEINEMVEKVHLNARKHGWWEEKRTPLEIQMLIVSEVAEATEEVRNHKPPIYFKRADKLVSAAYTPAEFETILQDESTRIADFKPEGEAIELADVVIRVMDYFGAMGWDLGQAIQYKHQYNETRPYKHGNKLL